MKNIVELIIKIKINPLSKGLAFFIALMVFVPSVWAGSTDFYVDSNYTGGSSDGSQSHPWITLNSSAWSQINSALTSHSVTVYFSARLASSDTNSIYGGSSPAGIDLTQLTAAETSSYTITFDGHSFYNSNVSTPDWSSYSGTSRCNVANFISENSSHLHYNNITINGFVITTNPAPAYGSNKCISICGNNWLIENNDISSTPGATGGPCVMIVPTANAAYNGAGENCPAENNITITNNDIHDSYGELIYAGGAGCESGHFDASAEGANNGTPNCEGFTGQDFVGASNVTISYNNLYNGGMQGAQGDGIDVKGGYSNLKIIGNDIHDLTDPNHSGIRAIVMQGKRPSDPDQNVLIANNTIHDINTTSGAINLVDSWGTPGGVTIEDNVIYNSFANGIELSAGSDLYVYNNTIYNSKGWGVSASGTTSPSPVNPTTTATVTNNILLSNNINTGGGQTNFQNGSSIASSYNAFSNTWNTEGIGTCTTSQNCISGLLSADFVNVTGYDFHLISSFLTRGVGSNLSSIFTTDKDGNPRPSTGPWDMGAYQYNVSNPYALSITTTGTGSGTVTCDGSPCPASFHAGTQVTLMESPAAGSVFAGWSGGSCGGTEMCVVAMNSNQSLTANFTASGVLYGDVNGDGQVTIYDVEQTERYAVGMPVTNFNAAAAEVDGKGKVDMYDAFLISQYAVGKINKFPVQR